MQVVVDQQLVEYQLLGTGDKTVLLLHGWTDSAQQSFSGLVGKLATQYRILLPDLPGFGKSSPPPDTWGIPQYGAFVRDLVDKLEIKPDIVIAHSFGGTLAIYAASHGFIRPNKIILLGSAGIREPASAKRTAMKLAAKPVKLALLPLPKTTQERIKKRVYGRLGSDLYVLERMKPIFLRTLSYDIRAEAQSVAMPTLLIYGKDDHSTPVRHGRLLLQSLPGSRLEIVEAAGHYVHIDQPEQTLRLIEDFLA